MSILDRYLCRIWLRLLSLCLSAFVAIYLVIDLIEKIPRFLRAGGAAADMAQYFLWKLPEMVSRTAMFSVLMATLLTLGVLSRDSELTAMRSCGISIVRIAVPLLMLGLSSSLLLLVNAEIVLPYSYARTEMIDRVVIKKQGERVAFKRNNIWFRFGPVILQARLFEPATRTLHGIVLWDVDNNLTPLGRTDAETAVYKEGRWQLNGVTRRWFDDSGAHTSDHEKSRIVGLQLNVEDLQVLRRDADNMSIRMLREYAENLRLGGYQAYRYLTLMHTKIASPFSALIMVMLGIPFALKNSRSSGIAMGIGAGVALGFAFFVINAVLLSYGRNGVLPPVVAAWGANILFLLGGVWLARTVKR